MTLHDFAAILRGVPELHDLNNCRLLKGIPWTGSQCCARRPDFPAMAQAVREAVEGKG